MASEVHVAVTTRHMERRLACDEELLSRDSPGEPIDLSNVSEWKDLHKQSLQKLLSGLYGRRRRENITRKAGLSRSTSQASSRQSARGSTTNLVLEDVDELAFLPLDLWLGLVRRLRLMHWLYEALMRKATEAGLMNEKTLVEKYLVPVTVAAEFRDSETGQSNLLSFNVNDYKVPKEIQIPPYVVKILRKDSAKRTPEDAEVVSQIMSTLPSFRKYTKHRQLSMSRIVRYLKCESRRTVLRKGHMSHGIYYVFSGGVALKADDNAFSKNEIILRKGTCFGEIGILKNTRRNATLVTNEETEFLVIDKADFLANGLDNLQKQELYIRFEYLRNWLPLYHLSDSAIRDLSTHSHTEEYGYNQVVMDDSRKSDLLWFVVKGQCDVFKLVETSKLVRPDYSGHWCAMNRIDAAVTSKMSKVKQVPLYVAGSDEEIVKGKCPPNSCQVKPNPSIPLDPRYVCIKVGQLHTGDIFGVHNMFENSINFTTPQGRFCLASKGCAIIKFSALKFRELCQHLNVDWLEMERAVSTYPDDDEIANTLRHQNQWNYYKRYNVEELAVECSGISLRNYMDHRADPLSREGDKLLEYRRPLKRIGIGPSALSDFTHPLEASIRYLDLRRKRMDEKLLETQLKKQQMKQLKQQLLRQQQQQQAKAADHSDGRRTSVSIQPISNLLHKKRSNPKSAGSGRLTMGASVTTAVTDAVSFLSMPRTTRTQSRLLKSEAGESMTAASRRTFDSSRPTIDASKTATRVSSRLTAGSQITAST